MSAVEAVLAVVGLLALVSLAVGWHVGRQTEPPVSEEDAAAPYREGLHAAIRMQRVAQDLEAQMYAEAAKHVGLVARRPE
jgi:hypothetical protein